MKIYGVAILAGCYLMGKLLGDILGVWLNIDGNVGGVGFAMALLIFANTWLRKRGSLMPETEQGVLFWSAMYIPIVIAMSATQNVKAALSGGWVAVLAGIGCTLLCLMLVPVLSKVGRDSNSE